MNKISTLSFPVIIFQIFQNKSSQIIWAGYKQAKNKCKSRETIPFFSPLSEVVSHLVLGHVKKSTCCEFLYCFQPGVALQKWRKLQLLLKSIIEHDKAETFEWFIEDQAFSPSYDLAPLPPPPLLSRQQVVSLFLSLPLCRRVSLLTWEGGGGEEPNHSTTRKPGTL